MKIFLLPISFLFVILAHAQKNPASLVNTFIGTGGHGHTYPGASVPFGAVQLSPDTRMADWDGSSGYHYSDSVIYGFSHTHLSGTGIPDYCDLLLQPFTGTVEWDKERYRSPFSHKTEKARPGYYEVMLDKHHIKAQLTTTTRAGIHQYSFPKQSITGSILIDLQHRDQVLDSYIEKLNDHEIRGWRRSRSWAQDQVVYFHLVLEQPIDQFVIRGEAGPKAQGKALQAYVSAKLEKGNTIRCKAGISAVSMEGAKANLYAEMSGWNFNEIARSAYNEWNRELGKIKVKGNTRERQVIFYTALYHTFLVPNIFQDVDGSYRGTDGKIHVAKDHTNYSVFSLWDTYRAYHPLMTILNTRRTHDWIQTFLHQYRNGGMLPVWELAGNETFCMIGYHSVPVIVDAYQKGIRGFDAKEALKAMRDYAESDRFGLKPYRELGYIPNDLEHESVSKTLEYAYDDWCIAQFAAMIGDSTVYRQYMQRARHYQNLFDPQTDHMRGKLQASWHTPFDPSEINNFFTEGNAWQYNFAVPHDLETLIALHGGRDSFTANLKKLFTVSTKTTGRDQADVTGLVGQYAQGNEPSHHMAYLFNYVDTPAYTQAMVDILRFQFYKNDPDGLIGNEDCGQMSAWYLFSAMGFYPVCPGSGEYVIGTPDFKKITIQLENKKKFVIRATQKPHQVYVAGAKLNGKRYDKSFLPHDAIMNGGKMKFKLSVDPKRWGSGEGNRPHSVVQDQPFMAVPYFAASRTKFKDTLEVAVRSIDPNSHLEITCDGKTVSSTGPEWRMRIDRPMVFQARSVKGAIKSATVSQSYYKLPTDRSIIVETKPHPLYTGGGNEMLIDGLTGNTNWRAGEWQSYFNTDFIAIVDLQSVRPVSYVGVHVLQDISPWILYPKELVIYSSEDGRLYTELARVKNMVGQDQAAAQVQELGSELKTKARYIKVVALNGGSLPAWHESAGNPSHLFIDEIIVR